MNGWIGYSHGINTGDILPISYFAFKEKFSWQAILGTMLAIAGVAISFLA